MSALVHADLFARPGRRVDASVASGQDADALEAVDLDQFVRTNEVEVLALRRLSALGAADAKYLDNASVSGDAIAGTNTTGKGDLRSSRLGHGPQPARAPVGAPTARMAS